MVEARSLVEQPEAARRGLNPTPVAVVGPLPAMPPVVLVALSQSAVVWAQHAVKVVET